MKSVDDFGPSASRSSSSSWVVKFWLVTVSGPASCQMDRIDPDIDGQLAQMQAFLLTLDADYDLEENDIPLVGENFATEIFVSCPNT